MTTIEDVQRIEETKRTAGLLGEVKDPTDAWIDYATTTLGWDKAFAYLQLRLWDNPQWDAGNELEQETKDYFENVGNVCG